jgi:hypothetical protein
MSLYFGYRKGEGETKSKLIFSLRPLRLCGEKEL